MQDYLAKHYGKKTSKKKKSVKNASTVIIDDEVQWNKSDEEDAPVVVGIHDATKFKPVEQSWVDIRQSAQLVDKKRSPTPSPTSELPPSPIPKKRQRSPSPVTRSVSPVRKSPSPSPVRRSPSPSPVRRSPSPSPVRRSPSPSPVRRSPTVREARVQPATVYRDKTGRKVDVSELQPKPKPEPETVEWGKVDVKQPRIETQAPLSIYADDKHRNDELKTRDRWGDPLAKKKKKSKVYKGDPFPNRYNILPGYKWDGVDRSNGFEMKLLNSKYQAHHLKQQYQKWSTEDM